MDNFHIKQYFWYWRFHLITTWIYLSISSSNVKGQTTLTFCDGEDLFVVNEGECAGGINFGSRRPDCLCVSGVYRSWTDDCEIFDGFINEFCSSSINENDLYYKINGIKLISGVRDIYGDTAVVFGEQISDNQNWNAYIIGMEGWTKSDSFYSVNGFPVVLSNEQDRFICVEPQPQREQQVCRFYSYENKGVWMSDDGNTRIKVMDSCDPDVVTELKGYTLAQLREHKCYDIMNKTSSECSLSCQSGKEVRIPGSSYTGVVRRRKDTAVQVNKTKPSAAIEPEDSIPALSEKSIPSNANFDFHRKLNKYIRLRQVGLLPTPDLSAAPPSRTFTLLEIAKQVVRSACPSEFVSGVFLNNAMELFLFLHKGQNFRYLEDIELRDFKWIEEILLKCRVGMLDKPLRLKGDNQLPGCEHEGLVENVCYISDGDLSVCEKTTGGKEHQSGKYHFAIDAIWNIIDMTHALCYPYFQDSYRMFHIWEQASEKLFTRDIRNLWYKPEVDTRVYDAILSSQATLSMINLERCTEGAYRIAPLPRLQRPPKQKLNFRRRKRNADTQASTSVAKSVDVFCAKRDENFSTSC